MGREAGKVVAGCIGHRQRTEAHHIGAEEPGRAMAAPKEARGPSFPFPAVR